MGSYKNIFSPSRAWNADLLHGVFNSLPIAASWAALPGGIIQFNNRAFNELFDYPVDYFQTAGQFIDMVCIDPMHRLRMWEQWRNFQAVEQKGTTEIPEMELDILRLDGSVHTVRHRGVIVWDLKVTIALFEDITEQKRLNTMLSRLAHRDPLTGLANRHSLQERWNQEIAKDAGRHPITFLMIDLDGFKQINDTHGHEAGDEVLLKVSQHLCGVARDTDLVCRMGGDEFGILFPGPGTMEQVDALCHRVIDAVQQTMMINGLELRVGASIGACRYPDQASNLREMLAHADRALYQAKFGGKGHWRWYKAGLSASDNASVVTDDNSR